MLIGIAMDQQNLNYQRMCQHFVFNHNLVKSSQTLTSIVKNLLLFLLGKSDYVYCRFGKVKYHAILNEKHTSNIDSTQDDRQ